MGSRGRKSAASLAVATIIRSGNETTRVTPAEGLSEAEVAIWTDVVAAMPAGFIRPENIEQLAAYCRHCVSARDLSRMVTDFKPAWLKAEGGLERYDRLLKMRDRESRSALAAARSLRITIQSVDPKTAGRAAASGATASYYEARKLWE